MDEEERAKLASKSAASKNKKVLDLLPHAETFIEVLNRGCHNAEMTSAIENDENLKAIQGRDINVCVRIRPSLHFESDYFPIVDTNNVNKIIAVEPKLDFKKKPRELKSEFEVDFAFGASHENSQVYEKAAKPLVQLGLQNGVCTLLAYGQTGSGKTHTISGILDNIAQDLFEFPTGANIKLYLSFFELLGSNITDLLTDEENKIDIKEDQIGRTVVLNATEIELNHPEHFKELVKTAFSHRRTETTFKNDTSSRSHAVCQLRVKNLNFPAAEDGRIFIIDLAGSETAVDSQFHGKERVKETKEINKSLMALKECIRNRALAALDLDKYYHIPYRQSKLTLLLKDAFEVESKRICKTVFIACVAPTCLDSAMTMNTLRYAAPIRVGETGVKIQVNPDNPANWSNEELRNFVHVESKGKVDPEILCPVESGMQMLRMPEPEFLARLMRSSPTMTEKGAKNFYTKLWKLLIDIRMLERRAKVERKQKKVPKARGEWSIQMLESKMQIKKNKLARQDEEQRIEYLSTLINEYKEE